MEFLDLKFLTALLTELAVSAALFFWTKKRFAELEGQLAEMGQHINMQAKVLGAVMQVLETNGLADRETIGQLVNQQQSQHAGGQAAAGGKGGASGRRPGQETEHDQDEGQTDGSGGAGRRRKKSALKGAGERRGRRRREERDEPDAREEAAIIDDLIADEVEGAKGHATDAEDEPPDTDARGSDSDEDGGKKNMGHLL